LREKKLEADEVNYGRTGLDAATVQSLVSAAGGVAAVINKRHELAKKNGWDVSPPRPADFAAAVAKEPNLLRRPILLVGKKVLVGFDRDAYAKL
jgi:arsenate reductase-like glutaredoxin family protein